MTANLYTEFCDSADRHPHDILVHQFDGGEYRKFSYRRIQQDAGILSSYFLEQNLEPGDRVAILSENRPESIVAFMACASLGLVVVPLDPKWAPHEWAVPLNHAEVRLLLVSDNLAQKVRATLPGTPCLRRVIVYRTAGDIYGAVSLDNLLEVGRRVPSRSCPADTTPDHTAAVIYTSGTTGQSKGVVLTHGNLISSARLMQRAYGREGEVMATIVPLNHVLGLSTCNWACLAGMSIVLFPKLDPDIVHEAFRAARPHYFVTVPLFLERLAAKIEHHLAASEGPRLRGWIERALAGRLGARGDLLGLCKKVLFRRVHRTLGGRLKFFTCGGAPLDPDTARFLNTLGVKVFEGYGLTETSSAIAANDDRAYRLGSVGKVPPEIRTRIDQPDGEGIGEICVRGPVVMKGYYKDPVETRNAFDAGGWFHTGDLGRIDEDGFLFITGRKKDLIVTANGKNVYPQEIEEFFAKIPWIREVCALGVGRAPGAVQEVVHLQIVPDFEKALADGIADVHPLIRREVRRMSEDLPDYKRPRSIGFSRDPFPRTSTLKVRKNLLKDAFLKEELERRKTHPATGAVPEFQRPVGAAVVRLLKHLGTGEVLDLSPDSSLSMDLCLDSLTILDFWSRLEKAFRVRLPDAAKAELKTVAQVIRFLEGLPDSNPQGLDGSMGRELGKRAYESWDEILAVDAAANRSRVQALLAKQRRARPLFLKAFRGFFRLFSGLEIRGLSHLPGAGPFILAPNHQSHLDNLFVACQLPGWMQENVVVVGKREHFENRLTRTVAELCHAIPVDRENVSHTTLQLCAQVLRDGKILLVHPEGTRSPDGNLLPLKPGAAILAQHVPCPVVPVYIEGAHEFWPKDSTLPRARSHIIVTVGEALRPARAEERDSEPESASRAVEELTRQMTTQLIALARATAPG